MKTLILAKNNDIETAKRIAEHVSPDYLKQIKPEATADWLDNAGLYGRWQHWPANGPLEAERIASQLHNSGFGYVSIFMVKDPGTPITADILKAITGKLAASL